MPQTMITFDELEANLFKSRMEELFRQAYEKGVEDGMKRFSYPPVLTKEHLKEIFQVEPATVNKLVAYPTFPKFNEVRARYPRDRVFEWIDQNSTWVKQNTNYFSKEVI
jgi:hypothetical protein